MSNSNEGNPNEEPQKTTRREFLTTTARGAAAASLLVGAASSASAAYQANPNELKGIGKAQAKAMVGDKIKPTVGMAKGRVIGANDRILIGHVGIGGQGGTHVRLLGDKHAENNTQSIGVSDCYIPRMEGNKAEILKRDADAKVQMEGDYRRLLENKDIDAIVIATPEHWHAQVAVDAMEAGKHIYCEKPMTRYLNEAFAVYDTQKRTGKVLQVGSQGCSDTKWHVAGDAVKAGKIGQLVASQGSYTRNSKGGEWNYFIEPRANPDNLDWKMWLGSAPARPWSDDGPARFFRYRKYRDYSAGLLGDLLPHKIHPLMVAVFAGNPEFPMRVTTLGTKAVSTDREVADTCQVLAEFPGGHTMYFLVSTVNEQGIEDLIRGHKATLRFGGGHVNLNPERDWSEEIDAAELPVNGPGEDITVHEANWLDCIRTGKTPNANIDLAVRAQTVISLAEVSERTGRVANFDPKTRKVS